MKFYKTLDESIVNSLKTSFSSIKSSLESGWIDSSSPISPFGDNWGRGVFTSKGEAIITKYGTKHAVIKQRTSDNTDFTFYWGYIPSNKTLYLEIASVRGTGFNKSNVPIICSAIIDRMKYTWAVTADKILWENNSIDILSI